MYKRLFKDFLISGDSLWVYKDSKLLFTSNRGGLLPLFEYIDGFATWYKKVTVFDKVIGNAAALLFVKADCRESYGPIVSQMAIKTLDQYGINYNPTEIVPYIQQKISEEMCPMERLSMGKDPDEFYEAMTIK